MKKTILIMAVLVLAVLISGCSKSPSAKVEQLEKNVNDINETSGYNACIAKVDEKVKAQEDCTKAKVIEKGYTDGLNCIADYTNPICKDTARYNAEVYGGNDCIPITDKITPLNKIDCLKLLENK